MKKLLFLSIMAISMAACSPYVLRSSGALNNSDLADYKSFQIQKIEKDKLPEGIMAEDLMRVYYVLGKELERRGYTQVEKGGDLTMYLGITTQSNLETSVDSSSAVRPYVGMPLARAAAVNRYTYFGATPYVNGYLADATLETEVKTDGVLMVDLVDNSNNNHVFYSQISADVDGRQLIIKDNEKLTKAAQTVFKKFPIPVVK